MIGIKVKNDWNKSKNWLKEKDERKEGEKEMKRRANEKNKKIFLSN